LELNQETLTWVLSLSLSKSNTNPDGSIINEYKSGSGHLHVNVNDSMGALVMMVFFFLVVSSVYMAYRVYMQRKYLSEAWLKEHGKAPKKIEKSDGQNSREIPKELNDSAAGSRGLPTDPFAANSKRELVPPSEKKQK
jgi:hypothetical protein